MLLLSVCLQTSPATAFVPDPASYHKQLTRFFSITERTIRMVFGFIVHTILAMDPGTLPDLFLLDYYLPRMNGLDLYDRLHAIETLAHVTMIFMSANPPFKELQKLH